MTVEEVVDGGVTIFRLSGELDMKAAPALKQQLMTRATGGRPCVVITLTELRYVDSAGLDVLVNAQKAFTANGGMLRLAAPRPEVRNILQITRLLTFFTVHDTEAEAVGALR
jgi:anti-sigma B factor antagonist